MKTVKVMDLGQIITGNTPSRSKPELYGSYIPFIKATDITESQKYTYTPEEYYSEEGYKKYKNSLIPRGSTCVVTIGSIGKKMTMANCDCFINQAMNAIIPNSEYDNQYVYYLMKNNIQKLKMLDSGTASGRENVSKTAFSNMELQVIEDKFIQERIGSVLSKYDAFIENNQKQIILLEEAAQRLYKEWFVDLRFPGYEDVKIVDGVPEGWKLCNLCDVVSINDENISKKYSYDYIDYVDLGSVSKGHIKTVTRYSLKDAPGRAKRVAKDGDVAWGMVRPNLKSFAYVFNPTETMIFSTGFAILHPVKIPYAFLYCYVSTDEFVKYLINCTNGAAYPAVKTEHFEAAKILIASAEILNQFQSILEPIFRKIELLDKQNKVIVEARDRLLPKLMSGELEV